MITLRISGGCSIGFEALLGVGYNYTYITKIRVVKVTKGGGNNELWYSMII